MARNDRMRRRLIKLWLEDNGCHFCGRPTILVVSPGELKGKCRQITHFPERATIDHLNSKLSVTRIQRHDGVPQTVLACYECNQRRSREEQAALPPQELRRRSARQYASRPRLAVE